MAGFFNSETSSQDWSGNLYRRPRQFVIISSGCSATDWTLVYHRRHFADGRDIFGLPLHC